MQQSYFGNNVQQHMCHMATEFSFHAAHNHARESSVQS